MKKENCQGYKCYVVLSDQHGYYGAQPPYPTQPGYPSGQNQGYPPPYTSTPGFVVPPASAPPYGEVPLGTGQPYGTTNQQAMYGSSYATDDPLTDTDRVDNFTFDNKTIRRGFIR
jgi:hypothetical protein